MLLYPQIALNPKQEISLFNRRRPFQKTTTNQNVETSDCVVSNTNKSIYNTTPVPNAQGSSWNVCM